MEEDIWDTSVRSLPFDGVVRRVIYRIARVIDPKE